MSRKSLSRRLSGVALLVGLAGFAVSTAGVAVAAPYPGDPADSFTAQAVPLGATAAQGAAAAGQAGAADAGQAGAADAGQAGAAAATQADGTGSPAALTADARGYQAVAVTVERTRGKYHTSTFQVAGGLRQSGEVLRLASSPAFRMLDRQYLPPTKCCNRYRYDVKVTYRNGRTQRVVTYSNTPGVPKVLLEVIRKVETMPVPSFPPGFPFTGGFPFG